MGQPAREGRARARAAHGGAAAGSAGAGGGWGDAEEVPGSAALNKGGGGGIEAVSCPSAGNCGAGGFFVNAAGGALPLVDSETDGVWGGAVELPGSAALNTSGDMMIVTISCSAAGDCGAGGVYDSTSSSTSETGQAFVASEVNGVWHDPVPVAVALNAGDDAQVSEVSCPSAGNCVAGGYYIDSGGDIQPFVVGEAGGSWGLAGKVTGAGAAGAIATVSCASAGNCAAGGQYGDNSTLTAQAFVADEAGGVWGAAQEVPGSETLNSGGSAQINSVSCASAGDCTAGGNFTDSAGGTQALVVTEAGGNWGTAQELPGSGALNSAGDATVAVVSCASAGNCGIVGGYDIQLSGSGLPETGEAFVAGEADGHWSGAEQMPGTAGLGTGPDLITALSCPSAGNCGAGGVHLTTATSFQGFVVSEVDGVWEAAQQVPGLAQLDTGGIALVSSVSCATGGDCTAGGVYVDGSGHSQAFVTGSGCEQLAEPDGEYEFGGCVTAEDDGTVDVTNQQSNLDGVDVSASSSDEVTYDDGTSAGHELTSTAASTLSLDLAGTLIPVHTGKLDDSLTAPITVTVPGAGAGPAATAKATLVAGLPISGKLEFKPGVTGGKPKGTLTATVGTTLPAALGGGAATLTATSALSKGLTSVSVNAKKASFMQLVNLTGVSLSWKAGANGHESWTVKATAPGGKKLTGTLTYDNDELASATLTASNVSVAGLVDVSALTVKYNAGDWSGLLTIGTGKTAATTKFKLTFGEGGLDSASISAANVSVFGVLDVSKFDLSYAGGTWKITITAKDGGGASGSMTATGGVISAADLTVTKVSFLGKFTVDSARVSYAAQAPNAACDTVTGADIWCGSWQVLLPSASVVSGVSGTLAVANGQFASGSVDITGNVPLLDGINLTKLAGRVTVNPPPTTISGKVGLRFGPKIKGTSLLDLTGQLTRQLPGGDTSGFYMFTGDLSALGVLTGSVTVTVPGDGAATTIALTATAAVRGASATGDLRGSFSSDGFALTGHVAITVLGHKVNGSLAADDKGVAACGSYKGHQSEAFEYDWATRSVAFLGTSGCSEAGF